METYRAAPVNSKGNRTVIFVGLVTAAIMLILWGLFKPASPPMIRKAVVVLSGPESKAFGTVAFEQVSSTGAVTVTGDLQNLDPSVRRGFHIHQLGDTTNGCLSAGPHFNPYNKNHGAPSDSERHVGDLGNIESDRFGIAKFTIQDSMITLNGPLSIVGRTVVLHAGVDDLGKGNNAESRKTGNAGARSACGIIGIAELV